jgi:hypothetical protein
MLSPKRPKKGLDSKYQLIPYYDQTSFVFGNSAQNQTSQRSLITGNLAILKPIVIALDALELGYSFKDITATLIDLLVEIKPGHYVGQSLPQRSYEDEIFGSELFAFRWESKRLGCWIYLKFAFSENRLWLISFHQDRVDPKGR